jgi:hypothetical protein
VAKKTSNDEFLRLAYCALVLRGYDNWKQIPDPILVEVWKRGKKLMKPTKTVPDGAA